MGLSSAEEKNVESLQSSNYGMTNGKGGAIAALIRNGFQVTPLLRRRLLLFYSFNLGPTCALRGSNPLPACS